MAAQRELTEFYEGTVVSFNRRTGKGVIKLKDAGNTFSFGLSTLLDSRDRRIPREGRYVHFQCDWKTHTVTAWEFDDYLNLMVLEQSLKSGPNKDNLWVPRHFMPDMNYWAGLRIVSGPSIIPGGNLIHKDDITAYFIRVKQWYLFERILREAGYKTDSILSRTTKDVSSRDEVSMDCSLV